MLQRPQVKSPARKLYADFTPAKPANASNYLDVFRASFWEACINAHGFFLVYFGLLAASIVHQFISLRDTVPEFLAKWLVGSAGAWVGPVAMGHWGFSQEGVWFLPEFAGALIAAFAVALLWKVRANARTHARNDNASRSDLRDRPTAA